MEKTELTKTDKTVCFAFANGCPRALVNMSVLVEYFKANKWEVTTNIGSASLIVFSCCAFDFYNEETSLHFLSIAMKKKRADGRMVVFGCFPGINRSRLLQEFDVTTIPPTAIGTFDELIGAQVKLSEIKEPNLLRGYEKQFSKCFNAVDRATVKSRLLKKFGDKVVSQALRRNDTRPLANHNIFEIKIAKGCLGNCTYCAIKNAVGRLRSKPIEKIMNEFHSGLEKGHKFVRYIAEDVGGYGQDIGTNIVELLKLTFAEGQDFKFIWDDFSPNWLVQYFPELYGLITKNKERIGYLGFPMQSGSDKVLEKMERGYTVGDVSRCLHELRQAVPDLQLTTHVLIGFPGETESDFVASMEFLRDIKFNHIQAYRYCDRPSTPALEFPDKVSEKIKSERVREFKKLFPAAYI